MFRSALYALCGAAMLAALPTAATAAPKATPEQKLEKILEGRVAGEPRNCIPLHMVNSSQIIDKTAIVYRSGSTIWVNRPAGGAASLNDSDTMVTKTVGSQLCSIDTVQLVDASSRSWRGFVNLGEFVPYRRAD
jgi:hypothetical protein